MDAALARVGLIVHPSRDVQGAIATLETWARRRQTELVALTADSPAADVAACELVVALGGDGTALAALHLAGPVDRPVLGVACGSLGALTSVAGDEVTAALEEVDAGRSTPVRVPALELTCDDVQAGMAINDIAVVRDGLGQVLVSVSLDGVAYAAIAGDGLVVATELGSSAYAMAAGGPLLATGAGAMVVTPLAPHGGSVPPLVVGNDGRLSLTVEPGHGGVRYEIDGRPAAADGRRLAIGLRADYATLIRLAGEEPRLTGLRRRGLVLDSPRVLVRQARPLSPPAPPPSP
jgi:NAD+ kinase